MVWKVAQELKHREREPAFGHELVSQFIQGRGCGKGAMPEQMGDLFEAAVLGKILNQIAPVDQASRLPIDVADGGIGHDDIRKPFADFRLSVIGHAL